MNSKPQPTKREEYERRLRVRTLVWTLRAVVIVESLVWVFGTFLVGRAWVGASLIMMVMVTYQGICAYVADSKFALAVYLISIPNVLLAGVVYADYLYRGGPIGPVYYIWMACTLTVALVSVLLLVIAPAAEPQSTPPY